MFWLIFTLVYLISFAIHILDIWYKHKRHIFKVGDIIDYIQFYMLCPILNTAYLILLVVCFTFMCLIKLTKLDKLWDKFRNIKIK